MFTDTELGMALAHGRQMKSFGRDAQGLVDELDNDITVLRAQLAAVRAELADELALRLSVEMKLAKLNRILDTPIH